MGTDIRWSAGTRRRIAVFAYRNGRSLLAAATLALLASIASAAADQPRDGAQIAFAFAAPAATPSAALENLQRIALPEALKGVKIFRPGTAKPRSNVPAALARSNPDIGGGLGKIKSASKAAVASLTPTHPFKKEVGALDIEAAGGYFTAPFFAGASGLVLMNPTTLIQIEFNSNAGQTYLIDMSVNSGPATAKGCQFVVKGPNSDQQSFACVAAADPQHLLVGYEATQSGYVQFSLQVENPPSGNAGFFGVAFKPVQ